jgi:dTDP-4-amino-4,6-dideoxygalactose transaminase
MSPRNEKNPKIPISKPWCDARILKEVYKTYISGNWDPGEKTILFEEEFKTLLNVSKELSINAINSDTTAIQIILRSLNIQPGDEIILPTLINTTIINAIMNIKAIPIFADIEYDTLNINPKDIETKITPKTKAICSVHCSGEPCDIDSIMILSEKHNLKIIEDCSQACGGNYKGLHSDKKIGSLGNISLFSLNTNQKLPVGTGTIIVYNPIHNIIINKEDRLNNIVSSIGRGQLKELNRINESLKESTKNYNEQFSNISQIETPKIKETHSNYIIKLHGTNKEPLILYLANLNIIAKSVPVPIYNIEKYKIYNKHDTPISETIYNKLLYLPMYPSVHLKQGRVTSAIKTYFKRLDKKKTNENNTNQI